MTTITDAAGRSYHVDQDGFCAELEAFITRDLEGRLVTIPID